MSDSPDPARVRVIFLGALDVDEHEMTSYLDDACGGDEALRSEVVSLLLGFHDDPDRMETATHEAFIQTLVEGTGRRRDPADGPRYRALELLGVGGCGRVVRAWDGVLKRVVAHKRVTSDAPVYREMLRREARLLAWLDHPGAVPVFDGGFTEDDAFYTMRVLNGETLRDRLDREPRLPIREAVRILARVGETMANAHAKGVLHLDLKPANIMLLPYGQVCVLDWGLAKFHDRAAYEAFRTAFEDADLAIESGYGGVGGTPAYMPVEQAVGSELKPTADIFACGTMLYEMLVGALPHPIRASPRAVLQKALVEVVPPRTLRGDLPEALEALCLAMLERDPDDRPPGFEAVLRALDGLTQGVYGAEERVLEPGDVLFREGDVGTEAFQILSGRVSVHLDGPDGATEIAQRTVGDLIGEMAVVSGAPRSATVTALEPTRVSVVTGSVIEGALRNADPLLAKMLRSLVDRLRQEAHRTRGPATH